MQKFKTLSFYRLQLSVDKITKSALINDPKNGVLVPSDYSALRNLIKQIGRGDFE
jgi:hypothetical protein